MKLAEVEQVVASCSAVVRASRPISFISMILKEMDSLPM